MPATIQTLEQFSPVPGVQGDGPGVLHLPGQQRGAHGAVQPGHLDLVQVALHPVDVPCDPVHGQALGSGQAVLDHHLEAGQGWGRHTKGTERWSLSCAMLQLVQKEKGSVTHIL